jgi:hypothetical protein
MILLRFQTIIAADLLLLKEGYKQKISQIK